jgi:hypothetical protein
VNSAVSFVGQSGAAYSFQDIADASVVPHTAGIFLFVRLSEGERVVVFVGNCHDLINEGGDRWEEAVQEHGATRAFVRRVVSSRVRQQEQDDLVRRFEPAMNEVMQAAGTGGR